MQQVGGASVVLRRWVRILDQDSVMSLGHFGSNYSLLSLRCPGSKWRDQEITYLN